VISPSSDVVVTPQINSKVNPFLNVNYRKRFYSGMLEARGGFTYDKDFDIRGDRFGKASARSSKCCRAGSGSRSMAAAMTGFWKAARA